MSKRLNAIGHLVESPRKFADFILAPGTHTRRKVPLAKSLDGLPEDSNGVARLVASM